MTPETEIKILKLEKTIAELDADWLYRQDEFKVTSRGKDYIPTTDNKVVVNLFLGVIFIVILLFLLSKIELNTALGLIIMSLYAIFSDRMEVRIVRKYKEQKEIYTRQRQQLMQELKTLKNET